uniref:protein-tyrosine-phosphatase n=1 Tax=Meloidogyne javanica TaxID=6303 RepID=A0A915LW77_MELJA
MQHHESIHSSKSRVVSTTTSSCSSGYTSSGGYTTISNLSSSSAACRRQSEADLELTMQSLAVTKAKNEENEMVRQQKSNQIQIKRRSKTQLAKCLQLDLVSISNCKNVRIDSENSSDGANNNKIENSVSNLSPWGKRQFQHNRRGQSTLFPVHILPFLYLGNVDTAKNRQTLEKCDIRYVINVTSDLPNYFECDAKDEQLNGGNGASDITYMRIPVDDNCSHNLAQFFPEAISFIEHARSQKAGILVHCWAGISRSVTVCLAYLMYSQRCTLEEAFDRLFKQNGTIAPNFHFMEALTCWERELFASHFSSSAMGINLPPTLSTQQQNISTTASLNGGNVVVVPGPPCSPSASSPAFKQFKGFEAVVP